MTRRLIPRVEPGAVDSDSPPVVVVPVGKPLNTSRLGAKARALRTFMHARVVGQEEAIEQICECHQAFQASLDPPGKPVASIFLMGPTGVGKTRVVEAFAEAVHGTPKAMVKIDCGEFQMDHEVAKLVGAPPGYLGHRETKAVLDAGRLKASGSDKSKLTIVLFDEIEKAAPSLWRILLGVLDKGIITLGDNTTVSFENSIIFFTSNLGVKEINELISPGLGFAPGESLTDGHNGKLGLKIEKAAIGAVARAFPPEFLNRLDKQLIFHPLSPEDLRKVQKLEIEAIQARINRQLPLEVALDDGAKEWLAAVNYDPKYGARQMKRQLERYLVRPLANLIQSGQCGAGDLVQVSCNSEGLVFIKGSVGREEESIPSGEGV